jgi:hypothetical protein
MEFDIWGEVCDNCASEPAPRNQVSIEFFCSRLGGFFFVRRNLSSSCRADGAADFSSSCAG